MDEKHLELKCGPKLGCNWDPFFFTTSTGSLIDYRFAIVGVHNRLGAGGSRGPSAHRPPPSVARWGGFAARSRPLAQDASVLSLLWRRGGGASRWWLVKDEPRIVERPISGFPRAAELVGSVCWWFPCRGYAGPAR